jgi:hypothetical protein
MAVKEVLSVTPMANNFGTSHKMWRVTFTGPNGLTDWKTIEAKDELSAYLKVLVIP